MFRLLVLDVMLTKLFIIKKVVAEFAIFAWFLVVIPYNLLLAMPSGHLCTFNNHRLIRLDDTRPTLGAILHRMKV